MTATPADGAVIQAAPARFVLGFTEPVSPLVLNLIGPDGATTALTDYVVRDRTLDIAAPPELGGGTHVLAWRIVSEDGHPVGGSVAFSIGAPSATPPALNETIDWSLRAALWSAKVAFYLGLFLGSGGVFGSRWLNPETHSGLRIGVGFVVLGLAATAPSVGLQGLDALGAPLSAAFTPAVWSAGFGTSFGTTATLAAMALLLALVAAVATGTAARALAGLAVLGVGTALAASGHASAAEPQWLTRAMVFLHGAGIAVWAGALLPLALACRSGAPQAGKALGRFTRAILPIFAMLTAAGIVLAIVQVETPGALLDTAYGNVLLVKLVLVAALLALAAFNRWRLTRPALAGDATATARLVRSIALETAVVILIFAVAAAWRFTPPPRTLAIAAAQPAILHVHTEQAMADMTLAPGRVGPVNVSIVVMTGEFGPLDARQVTLVLSNPAGGAEPIRRAAHKPGDGTWRIDALVIPAPGKWDAQIDIQITQSETARLDGTIEIRP